MKVRSTEEFYRDPRNSTGLMSGPCVVCRRAQMRKRYEPKRLFVDSLKSAGCMDCGWNVDPVGLDFDHRPDETKTVNISQMVVQTKYTEDDIRAEAAKCDLVCASCHRLRSKGRYGDRAERPRQARLHKGEIIKHVGPHILNRQARLRAQALRAPDFTDDASCIPVRLIPSVDADDTDDTVVRRQSDATVPAQPGIYSGQAGTCPPLLYDARTGAEHHPSRIRRGRISHSHPTSLP
jgi:hypothetical protein